MASATPNSCVIREIVFPENRFINNNIELKIGTRKSESRVRRRRHSRLDVNDLMRHGRRHALLQCFERIEAVDEIDEELYEAQHLCPCASAEMAFFVNVFRPEE